MPDDVLEEQVEETKTEGEAKPEEKPAEELLEEGEPGGSDGTAVYARKEHRRAERLAKELQAEREAKIAAEARAKTLEEVAKEKPEEKKAERRFTPAEVRAAVDGGTVTQADADEYNKDTAKLEALEALHKERETEGQQEKQKRVLTKIQEDLNSYIAHVPGLHDKESKEFQSVAKEFRRLVDEEGYEDSVRTELQAARLVLGPLSRFQRQKEIDTETRETQKEDLHSETAAGGDRGNGTTGGNPFAGIPKRMIDYWDRTNTTPEIRKKEAVYWRQRHPKPAAGR